MIGGLVFAILTTADRWLVLALLGAASLGEYTLASLLSSGMLLASMVVAQQFYPRMAMRFGRSGSGGLLRMAFLQGGAVLLLLVPVGLSLAVAGPWAITTWLPAYAPAIPALLMLMLGYGVLLAGTGFWNLLIVVGRADIYVGAQLFAIVAEAALSLLFVSFGFGIFGVAAAAATAFLLLTVVGATAAARVTL
jgi:O-antigen/teichoic acid export membrane protein